MSVHDIKTGDRLPSTVVLDPLKLTPLDRACTELEIAMKYLDRAEEWLGMVRRSCSSHRVLSRMVLHSGEIDEIQACILLLRGDLEDSAALVVDDE